MTLIYADGIVPSVFLALFCDHKLLGDENHCIFKTMLAIIAVSDTERQELQTEMTTPTLPHKKSLAPDLACICSAVFKRSSILSIEAGTFLYG